MAPSNHRFAFVRILTLLALSLGPVAVLPAAVPRIGRSGLPWNAGIFTGQVSTAATEEFEAWRKRPVDSMLFFPSRQTWDDVAKIAPDVIAFPGIKVIAVPPFPESLGKAGLARAARGDFDSWWIDYGRALVAAGLNNDRTVIRLGWELNGNWYAWSATTGREADFVSTWRHVVTAIRKGGATAVQFNWCINKGNQKDTDAWAAYPGDDTVDVVGLDFYDFWEPIRTDADFAREAAKVPGLDDVAAFCRAHGKQMALDEWGLAHGEHGGGDNPFFIEKIWGWLTAHREILAYETTYDDKGAPDTLHHKLSPPEGQSWNPRASARYLELWGGKP